MVQGGSGPAPGARDASAVTFAVATAGVIAGSEVAGRAARDGYYLSELPASSLPLAMAASALLAIAGTLAVSAWLRRSAPERVAPLTLVASGGVFVLLGALSAAAPRPAAALLYLHMTGLVPVAVSAFWAVVNERFDPYTAKTVVARMAAAGAIAGVIGGVAAERGSALLGIPAVLIALGALSALCGWSTLRLSSRVGVAPSPEPEEGAQVSGFRSATRHPLLRQMAVLMLVVAIVETLVDYALKVEAAAAFASRDALVRFFAAFYIGCGVLSFLIQVAVRDRLLRRFGLASAVAMLPASVALAGAFGAAASRLWGFVLARGAETVASLAFFRAGFQLLYTPMTPRVRRPAKAWVDVVAGSAGDLLGSALVFVLVASIPGLPSRFLLALASAGSLGALLIVVRIHRSYVRQLGESLRAGHVALRRDDAFDATTALTIARSQILPDRSALLAQARAHQAHRAAEAAPTVADRPEREPPTSDPSPRWLEELSSGDATRVRGVLKLDVVTAAGATEARRRRLAAHVVPLLEVDELASDAQQFLRARGARIAGLLVDELLEPDTPTRVRMGLAAVLGSLVDARAVAGLWKGVSNDDFDVRFACARAAARIASRDPSLAPPRSEVQARIASELDVSDDAWSRQGERPPAAAGERSALLSRASLGRVSRSVEHVFTLLSIAHGRELIASALAGLTSGDEALRGTALEYLESVLPAAQCRRLFARLDAGVAPPTRRSQQEIEQQLLLTAAHLLVEPDPTPGAD